MIICRAFHIEEDNEPMLCVMVEQTVADKDARAAFRTGIDESLCVEHTFPKLGIDFCINLVYHLHRANAMAVWTFYLFFMHLRHFLFLVFLPNSLFFVK